MKTKLTLLLLLILTSCELSNPKYKVRVYFNSNGYYDSYVCDSVTKTKTGIIAYKDGLKLELDKTQYKQISYR